jgi:hypothetical protein
MLRKVGAVVAGALVVLFVVGAIQFVSGRLYPLPEGVTPFDPADADAFRAYVLALPGTAWFLAFASELLGAFLGALTAWRIARDKRLWAPGTVIALATVASVMNWGSFPHPTWFIVGQLVGYPAVLLSIAAIARRPAPR